MKNEIENIFKQRFDDFEVAPSAGLFDAITAKRAKKKRAVWLWSAAALLTAVSIVGLGVWSISSNDGALTTEETPQQVPSKTTTKNPSQDKLLEAKIRSKNNSSAQNNRNTSTPKAVRSIKGEKIAAFVSTPTEVNETLAEQPITKTTAEQPKNVWAKLFAQIEKENPNTNTDKVTLFLGNEKREVDKQLTVVPVATLSTSTPVINKENTAATSTAKENPIGEKKEEEEEELLPLPTGKLVALGKWKVQTKAGIGYATRTLSATNQAYINLRNTTENIALSYQLGANVIYQFATKWNIQSGLQYTVRNEQFEHSTQAYTTENREIQRTETVIHPVRGEIERTYTEIVIDTTSVYTLRTSQSNRFQTISVPLVLERELYTSTKWSILAKAGVLAGVYTNRQGLLMTPSNEVQEYLLLPTRGAGIHNAMFGVGAQYHLSPRVSLLAYPEANVQLNSSTTKEAGFVQKDWGIFTHFGIRVGL